MVTPGPAYFKDSSGEGGSGNGIVSRILHFRRAQASTPKHTAWHGTTNNAATEVIKRQLE